MKRLNLSFLVLLCSFIFFFIIFVFVIKINSAYNKLDLETEKFQKLNEEIQSYLEYIKSIDENYKIAVYIKDLSKDFVIKINSDKLIPSASVVKVPIMAAVYYLVDKGELSLNDSLVYKKKHRCGGAGIIKRYSYGKRFKVRELVELMITISDNVATHMLMEKIGIERLNKIFKDLGLKNTDVKRYVMDLYSRNKGLENYTTAEDIGILLEKIYKGELISKEVSSNMLSLLMKQKISDRIPKKLPEEVNVAHKTGLMRNVCHDVGIVFTKNGDFVICVLTENMRSKFAKDIIAEISYKTYSLYGEVGNKDIEITNLESEVGIDESTNNSSWVDSGGN
ncbi:MAG: serine hydrolase [Endomicrobiia bacterium]